MACVICSHPERKEIEKAVARLSERKVAAKFQISRNVIQNHKKKHMEAIAIAHTSRQAKRRKTMLSNRLYRLLERADRAGDYQAAGRFIEQIRDIEREQASERPAKPEHTKDRSAYVVAIREALGFSHNAARNIPVAARRYTLNGGDYVRQCDPVDTSQQLRGLAVANPTNEKLLAACARVICFLERQTLPADLRDRMETLEADFDENELRMAGLVESDEGERDGETDSARTYRGSR